MSQTRPNKIVTITNDEVYDLATHQARMADSANVVVRVSSQSERDALPAVDGWCVVRLDLPGRPIERYDGAGWKTFLHVEYTYSTAAGAIPNATAWGPGALTLDSGAVTTDASIATISGGSDKLNIPTPGLYSVWFGGALGTAITNGSASWFAIKDSTDTVFHAVAPMVEFWGHASIPNFRVTAANTVLWFRLKQTSGGTNNSSGRIRITKIG